MIPVLKRILYGIYVIAIAVFFVYYLFPSEKIKRYLIDTVGQANPDVTLTIKRVKPILPPGLGLHDVEVYHRDAALIGLDSLKLTPVLWSLWGPKTTWAFNVQTCGGVIKGTADIAENAAQREILIDAQLAGIQIGQIAAIQNMSDNNLSGILGGQVAGTVSAPHPTLTGNLRISEIEIELAAPMFNEQTLTFRDIEADVALNQRALTIKRCRLQGNQMDADLAGTVALNGPAGPPGLKLSGRLKPHHVFLAKIEKSLPADLLSRNHKNADGFAFQINGTLDAPEFAFE
ncbi:MAG: type II secretion system protein GspN [Desulfobacterales bacterium]|nr:MAG: type II secretion system protein GspN [Desulfobacterales bacterium]